MNIHQTLHVILCAIWYRLYSFENVKNAHGVVFLLVNLQAEVCNLTKSNSPPWVLFMFSLIPQIVPSRAKHLKPLPLDIFVRCSDLLSIF